jgi:ATP-dependent Clp protease ATP-binding subunit ClpC
MRLDHNYVGTEHLLLGLLGDPSSRAGRLLAARGVDIAAMRIRLEAMVGRGAATVGGPIPLTPRSKRAIEIAMAQSPKRSDLVIEDNHLLLGLLEVGDGVAVGLLVESGVDIAERGRAANSPAS